MKGVGYNPISGKKGERRRESEKEKAPVGLFYFRRFQQTKVAKSEGGGQLLNPLPSIVQVFRPN